MQGIETEILKIAGEETTIRPFKVLSFMYGTGKIPKDFKKSDDRRCKRFHTISLRSYIFKILTKIIQRKMERMKTNQKIKGFSVQQKEM